LNNSAGITITWDLEDVTLTLGYDHQNYISSSSEFTQQNRSSELPLARAGLKLRPDLTVGVEASASYTTYDEAVLNNNQSYSAGLYADWKIGDYFDVQPRAGYLIYQFDHTSQSTQIPYFIGQPPPPGGTIQTADLSSWYADLTMSHQVNRVVSYSLKAGHEIRPGIASDAIADSYVRPGIHLKLIKDVTLNIGVSYEHGQQGAGNVTGNLTETYDYTGATFGADYALMKKLTLGLHYKHTIRSSGLANGAYTQNLVGLQMTYKL
jgi:hypothetical protein